MMVVDVLHYVAFLHGAMYMRIQYVLECGGPRLLLWRVFCSWAIDALMLSVFLQYPVPILN